MPPAQPNPIPRRVAERLAQLGLVSFSWDNRNAFWFGLVLTFSPSQRACFKVLWDNLFKGNLPVPNERILCGVRGETTHIYHYFKRHDAWRCRVIVGDGRGNFWLRLPSASELDSESMSPLLLPHRPSLIGGIVEVLQAEDHSLGSPADCP